ncbi:PQQ-binding-like beta-propeller repeat protein [Bremerella alba]|uniref:Outer membrane protein assembly factor BamB n=1 Tax=Bremerella alba TaxID=980252 RepID=A0A7V9A836_9BACT|nr:PQQ-binding-like beta-propeller repeat protein [Bremerella alba]MBA2116012.1 Outer membrane protein assembly factor BamB [Bremerella alba]
MHLLPVAGRSLLVTTFSVALVFLASQAGMADDWPQWMGPQRDDVYRESGVINAIPEDGLKVKWRVPISGGYAGPAVANGRVFVTDYLAASNEISNNPGARQDRQGKERVLAFSAESGEKLWEYAYDRPYSISYAVGPRCTPSVDGDLLYWMGAEGDLVCLQVETGELAWRRSLVDDFGAEIPIWGCSGHPLVDGDLLYVMVGGEGQGVVAFDKRSGEVQWKALDTKMGYAPPSIIETSGTRQLIIYHPEGVSSLNPKTGQQYWEIDIEPAFEMSIARPMVEGNRMYASGIGNQSVMIELEEDQPGAKALWYGEPKTSVYSGTATPLFVDGVVYGSDCSVGSLIAVDASNGDRLWTNFQATKPDETRFIKHGTAFLTRLGESDRYLVFSEVGDLLVAKMTKSGFESLGRFHVLDPTSEAFGRQVVWTHPAYANQTGFFRNDKELVAVDLAQE